MIVVHLKGGLGNQMFQYAAARNLAIKYRTKLYADLDSFLQTSREGYTARNYELGIFDISIKSINKNTKDAFYETSRKKNILKKLNLPYKKVYLEPGFPYNEELQNNRPPLYMDGYFQSEKYFEEIADTIRNDFKFNVKPDDENFQWAKKISSENAIGIHIRRTDYLTSAATLAFHGVCSIDYYKSAIEIISKDQTTTLYFFSDEPEWVRENLIPLYPNANVISFNKNENSWKDMYLMSKCKHNIVANSSFSWWAAWLNDNKNKIVVAPTPWFKDLSWNTKDLIPSKWIQLPI
jgi:hypothetical protein